MDNTIIRSMEIEALVVDDLIGGRDTFRRWNFSYKQLDSFHSPEPSSMNQNEEIAARGIWLRFILPKDLRTQKEGQQEYPLLPNRWLITRKEKGKDVPTSWVIESDCPLSSYMDTDTYDEAIVEASNYLVDEKLITAWQQSQDPYRNKVSYQELSAGGFLVNLGVAFPADNWKERYPGPLFLTAMAPGNPMFSAYVPHHVNILSFHDKLEGIEQGEFSYSIIGWYSDQSTHPEIYSRQIIQIPWHRKGVAISEQTDIYHDALTAIVQNKKLNVAIGESHEEAFRAFLNRRLQLDHAMSKEQIKELDILFAAFYYDMLDYQTQPAGMIRLANTIHDKKFEGKAGPSVYIIDADQEVRVQLSKTERDLLDSLHLFDQKVENLTSLRQQLLDMWWKQGYLKTMRRHTNPRKVADFDQFFATDDTKSLISMILKEMEELEQLYHLQPKEEEDIVAFGKKHGVALEHRLQKRPGVRYWREGNPVIVLCGVETAKDMEPDTCLSAGRKMDALQQPLGNRFLMPSHAVFPHAVEQAYQAALFIIEEPHQQDIPPIIWHQPWAPIFMEWRVQYQPLQLSSFYFDGNDYVPKESLVPDQDAYEYGGISPLDAHHKSLLSEKLKTLVEQQGDDQNHIYKDLCDSKILSQELLNLMDGFGQRDYRTFRRPHHEKTKDEAYVLEAVMGFASDDTSFLERTGMRLESVPLLNGDLYPQATPFRCGIAKITDLILYDAFGRVLNLILSGEGKGVFGEATFPLIKPAHMSVPRSFHELHPQNAFLLIPRLLQYGQLHMQFLTSALDQIVQGFLLVNHLHHSLVLYAPDGILIGELMVLYTEHQEKVCYCSANQQFPSIQDIINLYPVLGAIAEVQQQRSVHDFWAYLDTIDSSLWTMDAFNQPASDTRAVYIGRPLALVEAELYLDLEGLPMQDAGWEGGFEKAKEALNGQSFEVRIGDQSIRSDGVIGYYQEHVYDLFYSVGTPQVTGAGIQQIGPLKRQDATYVSVVYGKAKSAHIIILMDPRGSVHAYSGLFPVKELTIPAVEYNTSLQTMEAQFQIGPLVTCIATQEAVNTIQLPPLSQDKGTWSWLEQQQEYQPMFIDHKQHHVKETPSLREGVLVFKTEQTKDFKDPSERK